MFDVGSESEERYQPLGFLKYSLISDRQRKFIDIFSLDWYTSSREKCIFLKMLT